MNKYKVGMISALALFSLLCVAATAVGGLARLIFISMSSILLLAIIVAGMIVAAVEKKSAWWDYFKPLAAVPIAWGLLHLCFVLMFPDVSVNIWALHWKLLLVIEIVVFVLNTILSKNIPFPQRGSRKRLVFINVMLFVFALWLMVVRLFDGNFAASLNRELFGRLISSQVEQSGQKIEKLSKLQEVQPFLDELDEWEKKAEKRPLIETELKRVNELTKKSKKKFEVPELQKIKWEEIWPVTWLLDIKEWAEKDKKAPDVRPLSGIFKLPDGVIVDKTIDGREIWDKKGWRVQYRQLGEPGRFVIVNTKIPSWETNKPVITSGRVKKEGKKRLMSIAGKELMVQVKIVK